MEQGNGHLGRAFLRVRRIWAAQVFTTLGCDDEPIEVHSRESVLTGERLMIDLGCWFEDNRPANWIVLMDFTCCRCNLGRPRECLENLNLEIFRFEGFSVKNLQRGEISNLWSSTRARSPSIWNETFALRWLTSALRMSEENCVMNRSSKH